SYTVFSGKHLLVEAAVPGIASARSEVAGRSRDHRQPGHFVRLWIVDRRRRTGDVSAGLFDPPSGGAFCPHGAKRNRWHAGPGIRTKNGAGSLPERVDRCGLRFRSLPALRLDRTLRPGVDWSGYGTRCDLGNGWSARDRKRWFTALRRPN